MIFRAPAGHHLLNRTEVETMLEYIERGQHSAAKEYLEFCLDEIKFYDDIRREVEIKKMHQEDGETFKAQSIENKLREKVRQRVERNKLLKETLLGK